MAFASTYTRAKVGILAPLVEIEAHLSAGLPKFSVVGLPEAAVKESKDRVRSAILNSGFKFPDRRITINLAPADLPKDGGRYDLGMALAILVASEQLSGVDLSQFECYGELSLSGALKSARGMLPASLACKKEARRAALVSVEDEGEMHLSGGAFLSASSLLEAIEVLKEKRFSQPKAPSGTFAPQLDFADVRGHARVKRALCAAAAGGHHLLMIGPPGTGKSMMASRLPSILPPLSETEALEVASLYSISPLGFDPSLWRARPFRSPHHTISSVALVGGGSRPAPGEVSLAHRGVLFLDEMGEFPFKMLDLLRQPMETREIHIARASSRVVFPAEFQLIGAMNPFEGRTQVLGSSVSASLAKQLSSPLLDRIDIQVEAPRISSEEMRIGEGAPKTQSSAELRAAVEAAHARQYARQGCLNQGLSPQGVEAFCQAAPEALSLLNATLDRLKLSSRAYHRVLKVARTLCDLEEAPQIAPVHVAEAVGYRMLDRLSG